MCYLFDGAVIAFGTFVENSLLERKEVKRSKGQPSEWKEKYTLDQLLGIKPEPKEPVQTINDVFRMAGSVARWSK